jgi:hypothetical protein
MEIESSGETEVPSPIPTHFSGEERRKGGKEERRKEGMEERRKGGKEEKKKGKGRERKGKV